MEQAYIDHKNHKIKRHKTAQKNGMEYITKECCINLALYRNGPTIMRKTVRHN